jgi:hypothetical protein
MILVTVFSILMLSVGAAALSAGVAHDETAPQWVRERSIRKESL